MSNRGKPTSQKQGAGEGAEVNRITQKYFWIMYVLGIDHKVNPEYENVYPEEKSSLFLQKHKNLSIILNWKLSENKL